MVRLCKEQIDLECPELIEQLIDQVSATPGCALHGALECKSWSAWTRLNAAKHPEYLVKLEQEREQSRKLLMQFIRVAAVVLHFGGEVSFEWPRHAVGWSLPEVVAFIDQFGLREALFDGCRFGLLSHRGIPMRKPWKIITSSKRMALHLSQFRCMRGRDFKHDVVEGQDSRRSAFYPEVMARAMLVSLFPYASAFVAPALPCVPSLPQCHREKDTRPQLPLDLLMLESGMRELKVGGCVHRLLDRKEWVSQLGAHEAIGKEKNGLLEAGTWLESEIISKAEALAWATRTSNVIHIGSLMVILSVKGAELDPDLWKLKARIVFRGDSVRGNHGASAIFEELYASSPASLEGLNTVVAFGLLEGNGCATSDAVRAYVQAALKSKNKTFVLLPPELVPEGKKHIISPVAPLHKSLYGHPESSAHWAKHLHAILLELGGRELEGMPSVYFFEREGLILCVYVDDLTLSGRIEVHSAFWSVLSKRVELEPYAPLTRVLGRTHRPVWYNGIPALSLDTADFSKQRVELYVSISGRDVKLASTPHLDESTLPICDGESRGQLASSAARIIMKCLWLARLARPDLMVAVTSLASKVASWSPNDDRRCARLIGYIAATPDYSPVMYINNQPSELRLALYVDSDFGGCIHTARSTSGYVLVIEGDNSCAILSWSSKRQKVVSRSSTEAEFVSLSSALFSDAIPMLEVWQTLIPDIKLVCFEDNEACIAIVRKGFSAKLKHLMKTHRINVASTCEIVNGNDDIMLTYVNTAEQRGDPLTTALAVQKWGAALKLLGISTVKLPTREDA